MTIQSLKDNLSKLFLKKIPRSPQFLFLTIYIIVLTIYIISRAFSLSVVHDEAITFFISLKSYFEIFSFTSFGAFAVNNHLLNTVLIKSFLQIFGENQFFLRLPALIGYGLYLYFGVQISKLIFPKKWLPWVCVVLTLNPFLLDFFSLARGYSLAIGLMMGSIYFFFKSIEKKHSYKYFIYSIFIGIFSILANFSFITPFIAILCVRLGVSVYLIIKNKRLRTIKKIGQWLGVPLTVTPLIIYSLIGPQLTFLKNSGQLYVGGQSGFFQDTVLSLIQASLYHQSYTLFFSYFIFILLSVVFLVGLYILLQAHKDKDYTQAIYLFYISSILGLIIIGLQIQHILFRTVFVTDRAALYFLPLVIIWVFLVVEAALPLIKERFQKIITITGVLLVSLILIHTISASNFSETYIWKYDSDTKEIINDLVFIHQASPEVKITFWNNWKLEPSINYLKYNQQLTWLDWSYRVPPTEFYNVYILLPEDYELLDKYSLRIINQYENSGVIFAVKTNTSSLKIEQAN